MCVMRGRHMVPTWDLSLKPSTCLFSAIIDLDLLRFLFYSNKWKDIAFVLTRQQNTSEK